MGAADHEPFWSLTTVALIVAAYIGAAELLKRRFYRVAIDRALKPLRPLPPPIL